MLPKSSTGELIYAYGYDVILRLSGTPPIVAHAARAKATIQGWDMSSDSCHRFGVSTSIRIMFSDMSLVIESKWKFKDYLANVISYCRA
jgi:hypothetical protein